MELPTDRMPESLPGVELSAAFDIMPPAAAAPLDSPEFEGLHRAINERRAAQENPEMLRRLRSL